LTLVMVHGGLTPIAAAKMSSCLISFLSNDKHFAVLPTHSYKEPEISTQAGPPAKKDTSVNINLQEGRYTLRADVSSKSDGLVAGANCQYLPIQPDAGSVEAPSGGLRVRKTVADPGIGVPLVQEYHYGEGMLGDGTSTGLSSLSHPTYFPVMFTIPNPCGGSNWRECSIQRMSDSPYGALAGATWYGGVTVSNGQDFAFGGTRHTFSYGQDYADGLIISQNPSNGSTLLQSNPGSDGWGRGLPTGTAVFKTGPTGPVLLSATGIEYEADKIQELAITGYMVEGEGNRNIHTTYTCGEDFLYFPFCTADHVHWWKRQDDAGFDPEIPSTWKIYCRRGNSINKLHMIGCHEGEGTVEGFDWEHVSVSSYEVAPYWHRPVREWAVQFFPETGGSMSVETQTEWNASDYQMKSAVTLHNGQGTTRTTYRHPSDFAPSPAFLAYRLAAAGCIESHFDPRPCLEAAKRSMSDAGGNTLDLLLAEGMISLPVEAVSFDMASGVAVAGYRNTFSLHDGRPRLSSIHSLEVDGTDHAFYQDWEALEPSFSPSASFSAYGPSGNLMEFSLAGGSPSSYLWSHGGRRLFARISAATSREVASVASSGACAQVLGAPGGYGIQEAAHCLSALRDGLGGALVEGYLHDGAGRLVKMVDPAGRDSGFEYDGMGQLVKILDANGNPVLGYEYDNNED